MTKPTPHLLTISVKQQRLSYGAASLTCPNALLPFFVQLALNVQEGQRELTEVQWQLCAVVGGVQLPSLLTELHRYNAACKQALGLHCLRRQRGNGFVLAASLQNISLDLSKAEAQQLLLPYERKQSIEALSVLSQVERLFEQGLYHEAALALSPIWGLALHPIQMIEARCWECWIELRRSGDGEWVRHKTRELSRWFNTYDQPELLLPDIVRARVLIQLARTPMAYQQDEEARRRYAQARKLLPPDAWRELSSVEAGLGYIATRSGQLLEGELYYRLALHHAALAHWPWSVEIQLGNLADVLYERYLLLGLPPGPHPLLEEATELLNQAQRICDQNGFHGSGDTELYRARYALLSGDLAQAEQLVAQAFANIERSQTEYDYPLAWTVRAELQEACGQLAQSLSSLHTALTLEQRLNTGIDIPKLKQRIQRLEQLLLLNE